MKHRLLMVYGDAKGQEEAADSATYAILRKRIREKLRLKDELGLEKQFSY